MKKWLYKLIYKLICKDYEKPETIIFTYEFRGQGSKDILYEVEERKEFELPMTLDLINEDGNWDWPTAKKVKKAYADIISKREKELLVEARQEKYISLENEERVTGEYIVSVSCSIQVIWTKLSYEEYTTLENQEKEPKSI